MRRSSSLIVAGIAAGSLAVVFAAPGCGGTETTPTGSSGTASTGSGGGAPVVLAHPPAPDDNAPAGDGASPVTFAIKKLYLGDTDRNGMSNKVNGWKQYGYDLDGKASTVTSKDLCKPRNNAAPKNVYPDGDRGIDNSFGKNILGVILGIQMDAPAKVNQGLTDGKFTIMLSLDKLGTGKSYNGLMTKLYGGADLGGPPQFDGSTAWPVIPELLEDPADITSAKVRFPSSFLVNNTWVSGSKGDLQLNLSVGGLTLQLPIASAVLSMDLSEDHKSATNGTIAGVLPTDTLTAELKKVAGAFDPSLCTGAAIDSIVSQIEQASDIMADGSQDPSAFCDGISIGLGFDAGIVQLGAIAASKPPAANPCDMGAGGAGGGGVTSTTTGAGGAAASSTAATGG